MLTDLLFRIFKQETMQATYQKGHAMHKNFQWTQLQGTGLLWVNSRQNS